ncbi:MAG: hypothetical protein R3F43_18035 [bacterium]
MALVGALLGGGAYAGPPRASADLVQRVGEAQRTLVALARAPDPPSGRAALAAAEAAMATIDAGLDAAHHGPTLRTDRPTALALRDAVLRLHASDDAVLVLVDDVFRFRAELHDRLAAGWTAAGDAARGARHRMAAWVSAPTPERAEAAAAALEAAGQVPEAAALRRRSGQADVPLLDQKP